MSVFEIGGGIGAGDSRVVMTLHKLTASDGYTYLTRQVAAQDATTRGVDDLGSYYSDKGEAPGVWMGRGLAAVPEFPVGEHVTEAQMLALFGQGRHPNAEAIEAAAMALGRHPWHVDQASRLGRPYRVFDQTAMFHRRSAGAFRDYNIAHGQRTDHPVPDEVRARIRTELTRTMFVEQFGREPVDARELSGHLARISRQATSAVAGYDLSFSPVKSVSTLWAVAPQAIAAQIERAHHDAVKDVLTWLEDNATFTRTGSGAVAQVEVQGLIAAAFTHRDSRAGDPDLHTHVAISNKVQTLDGRWLALDGRPLYKNNIAASERYNTRLEALLIERLGVAFADRPGGDPGKRPVREILGTDGPLPRAWSSRRAAIDVRRALLSAQFQTDHGRPPTPKEAIALAQQANLATRERKHEPRSYAEQRAAWRAEALAILGGEAGLRYFVRDAMRGGPDHKQRSRSRRRPPAASRVWVAQTADEVVSILSSSRATWQPNHVRAEAERQARSAGIRLADLDRAVDSVVAEALSPARSVALNTHETVSRTVGRRVEEPSLLRRSDGTSVYTVVGSELFTSPEIIEAERSILATAGLRDGRKIAGTVIDIAILESAANGVQLNPGQVQLVRELATSGARVQLALAPAGTGKTTAMRVLSRAWTGGIDGGGQVIGLAPSAAAAAVLREEIGSDTDTLAKLIWHITNGGGPAWLTDIGPGTLVVIDEAGMAGTRDLAVAIEHVRDRGGSVRLIGDDQQLAAIGAGGVLRDIAEVHGAVTLSQVMRFTNPPGHPQAGAPNHAEGAASLALREGDPAAIAYYLDNGRVHVGDLSTVTDDAYAAWSTDRAHGVDAIMLAPTRDMVAQLNDRARTDRLAARTDQNTGQTRSEVRLADSSKASAGDTIITRHNDRQIPITATDWVKNGDRWTVDAVRKSGAMDVTHLRTGRHITLPADYAATHVALGYACTVHGAQGITAQACYTVATGAESRQLMYVAMTRGRHANHVYLTTAGDGDPHSVITRDALLPPTAGAILARVLARDASPVSATSQARTLNDPALRLATAAHAYHHALGVAAEDRLGTGGLNAIDAAAEAAVAGLTSHDAYPTLRAHLALRVLDGHDPAELLTRATSTDGSLANARDIAAVLDWRLDPTTTTTTTATGRGPLPWLPAIPHALNDDPEWGSYLQSRSALVAELAAEIASRSHTWTPASAPTWAAALIDVNPHSADGATRDSSADAARELVADLAIWRAAHAVEDSDRRRTGVAQQTAADARAQRSLDQRVTRLLGEPKAAAARWSGLADGIDPHITADPYWPTLADRLTVADRAGIDIAALARSLAADAPLPDEQPAAALWWRLAGQLSPAAMTATDRSVAETLRPDWVPALTAILGDNDAARVLADPAWPALVAAVTNATDTPVRPGRGAAWEPEQILATAHDLLLGGQPDSDPLRPDQLATALAWRVALLTDNTLDHLNSDTITPAGHTPNLVDDATRAVTATAPDHLALLPESTTGFDSHNDADWLRSLTENGPDSERDREAPSFGDPTGNTGDETDPLERILTALAAAEQRRENVQQTEDKEWALAGVTRARMLELNAAADNFFTSRYRSSWAAGYLAQRLPPELTDAARLAETGTGGGFSVGYAPDSWTALTTHLRQGGATDQEIVATGLGSYASTGRVIDRFRDRLMFPITARNDTHRADTPTEGVEIHGFIGRRNPTKTDDDKAGPKYLNTAETPLFKKSTELFGLADGAAALTAGAAPVLVEGPLDAIAVTLAGGGAYVGIAPLGTAFTDRQADQLRRYIGPNRPPIVVAFDADQAGQQAAHRAFWQLAARGADPTHLVVADGKDPSEYAQTAGAASLRASLDTAGSLADQAIADRIAPFADRLDTVEGRIHALRQAADVVGALPAATWQERTTRLAAQLDVAPHTAIREVLAAGSAWTQDPTGQARHQLSQRRLVPAPVVAIPDADLEIRWAPLATRIAGDLTSDRHWPMLAAHLAQADASGYDVETRLPLLVAQRPLPAQHASRELDLRLVADWPACLPSTEPVSDSTGSAELPATGTARSTITKRGPTDLSNDAAQDPRAAESRPDPDLFTTDPRSDNPPPLVSPDAVRHR